MTHSFDFVVDFLFADDIDRSYYEGVNAMVNPFSDQIDFTASACEQANLACSKWLEEVSFTQADQKYSTKPSPYIEEVVFSGQPGERVVLSRDDGSALTVLGDGSQRLQLGNQTIIANASGGVSLRGDGQFTIEPNPSGGQTITTPSNERIVVQDNRIRQVVSNGNWHVTDFVTPQEAKERAKQREEAREARRQELVEKTVQRMAEALNAGSIPENALSLAFSDALFEYGDRTATELVNKINEAIKDTPYTLKLEWADTKQNGGKVSPGDLIATLRIRNSSSGSETSIPIVFETRYYKGR